MKRIIALILLVCSCFASTFLFTSCDEESLRELTNKQWEAAVESNNFNNVTISATGIIAGIPETQIVKITETGVYREASATFNGEVEKYCQYFEGDEAVNQKNMFLAVFFELIKNKSNFVYDEANDQYTAPSDVTATIYPMGVEAGYKDIVLMQNGIVKFDENYNLSYFSCTLTETIYQGDATEPISQRPAVDTVWSVTDYGKTVISAEEKAAGTHAE